MSILDNTRLMVKVCKLCYEENMSQAEVSEKLHISKPQVSRIINAAREKGILNIYISNPFAEELELEKIFMKSTDLTKYLLPMQETVLLKHSSLLLPDNVHSSWKALCQTMQILVS